MDKIKVGNPTRTWMALDKSRWRLCVEIQKRQNAALMLRLLRPHQPMVVYYWHLGYCWFIFPVPSAVSLTQPRWNHPQNEARGHSERAPCRTETQLLGRWLHVQGRAAGRRDEHANNVITASACQNQQQTACLVFGSGFGIDLKVLKETKDTVKKWSLRKRSLFAYFRLFLIPVWIQTSVGVERFLVQGLLQDAQCGLRQRP